MYVGLVSENNSGGVSRGGGGETGVWGETGAKESDINRAKRADTRCLHCSHCTTRFIFLT